jgi:tetratricopeptide (TPR) repeat protein
MQAFENEKTSDLLETQAEGLEKQSRYAEAAQCHKRVLAARERVLGSSMKTAKSCFSLARCLSLIGRHNEALPYCERAREWIRAHQSVVGAAVANEVQILYGKILRSCGRLKDSLALFEGLLGTNIQGEGQIEVLSGMGGVYRDMGKYDEALTCFRMSYASVVKQKGEENEHALSALNNIAVTMQSAGNQSDQVLESLQKVYNGYVKLRGEEHLHTVQTASSISGVLHSMNRYQEAETWAKKALRASERAFGAENQPSLTIANALGTTLTSMKKYDEAEDVLENCLAGLEHLYGKDHSITLTTRANLALLYQAKGDLARALAEMSASHDSMKRTLGSGHPTTRRILQGIIQIQDQMGRFGDAAKNQEAILGAMMQYPLHEGHIRCIQKLAEFYRKDGDVTKAKSMEVRAMHLRNQIKSQH